MNYYFFICVLGAVGVVPVHFLSVEHLKLQKKYGKRKGTKIGEILGLISGWAFFLFWFGIWFSPQPRFFPPFFQNRSLLIPIIDFLIYLFSIIISIFFITLGVYFGIKGVKKTSLKVAETHRTEKIVTTGVYSIVRHPQYFGGLLSHVGISFLLSAEYSLLVTPLMIVVVFLFSKKEENELIREFGKEYEDYKKKVPMLIPKTCH